MSFLHKKVVGKQEVSLFYETFVVMERSFVYYENDPHRAETTAVIEIKPVCKDCLKIGDKSVVN